MINMNFPAPPVSEAAEALRVEVRDFLKTALEKHGAIGRAHSWYGFDPEFSRAVGARGWIGMTWPKAYGGHGRTNAERYVLLEEMLAAGAPVAAHWIADRQTGVSILRYGTEEQKHFFLPRMVAGELYTCIGMSEPDSGSDLASVRTKAELDGDHYRVNGTKLWTTNAHRANYMLLFCRTSGTPADRHKGTSQFLVDLSLPGITIRPITDMAGDAHFNEVVFEDVMVPRSALLGEEGNGWEQVMSELAYERSGPERFLSSMALLTEMIRWLKANPTPGAEAAVGRLVAHLMTLRRMSRGVAWMLEQGEDPSLQATMIKDLGAVFEQEIPEIVRQVVDLEFDTDEGAAFAELLAYTTASVPAYSLRGGTREILRGIIARGLGLR